MILKKVFSTQRAIASSLSLRTNIKFKEIEDNHISIDFLDLHIKEVISSADLTTIEKNLLGLLSMNL